MSPQASPQASHPASPHPSPRRSLPVSRPECQVASPLGFPLALRVSPPVSLLDNPVVYQLFNRQGCPLDSRRANPLASLRECLRAPRGSRRDNHLVSRLHSLLDSLPGSPQRYPRDSPVRNHPACLLCSPLRYHLVSLVGSPLRFPLHPRANPLENHLRSQVASRQVNHLGNRVDSPQVNPRVSHRVNPRAPLGSRLENRLDSLPENRLGSHQVSPPRCPARLRIVTGARWTAVQCRTRASEAVRCAPGVVTHTIMSGLSATCVR